MKKWLFRKLRAEKQEEPKKETKKVEPKFKLKKEVK